MSPYKEALREVVLLQGARNCEKLHPPLDMALCELWGGCDSPQCVYVCNCLCACSLVNLTNSRVLWTWNWYSRMCCLFQQAGRVAYDKHMEKEHDLGLCAKLLAHFTQYRNDNPVSSLETVERVYVPR